MRIYSVENVPEVLDLLKRTNELYYRPNEYITEHFDMLYELLTMRDVAELELIFKQAYNTRKMACRDCADHRLIQLEIRLGMLFEELDQRFKGVGFNDR